MNLEAWQEHNNRYLQAAVGKLRECLEAMAIKSGAMAAQHNKSPAESAEQRAGAADTEFHSALSILAQRLGLTQFESDVLLLCIAPELDMRIPGLCAAAQGSPERDYPTFALAMSLFAHAAWEVLSPERPLRYWYLVEITHPQARALTASALRADERIVNYVKGLNHLDERLIPLLALLPPFESRALAPSQNASVEAMLLELESRAHVASGVRLCSLHGADRTSKRHVARVAAHSLGLPLYAMHAEALPAGHGELEMLSRLWRRETLLSPAALFIDASELDTQGGAPDAPLQRLQRFLARTDGLVFLDSRGGLPLHVPSEISVDVARPTRPEQRQAWSAALGKAGTRLADQLSAQFDLNGEDIESVASAAVHRRRADPATDLRTLVWAACRSKTRPQLDRLAHRIDCRADWGQIVLPANELAALRQIVAQVRGRTRVYDDWGFRGRMNRGLGIAALFAGDSGTGKTMAAEVLAQELDLDLYRIDLSAVVSKYIGETEKNLRAVFDAAEGGGAILLFDEADALFGKRSEVRDAHDRYANIEINYLLQRMEAYSGLTILATNMKAALDGAFLRRLRFVINFPHPGEAERKEIWRRIFPRGAPLDDVDHSRLARLHLSGGNIQNVALNAAFLAAHEGPSITMEALLQAARAEMRKLDRPVNEADFKLSARAGAQR